MAIDQAKVCEPSLNVLLGISKEKGIEHYTVLEESWNIVKFKKWLQELRALNGEDKICLFMDNLRVHTSKKTKAEMTRQGFKWIYNVAYHPETNPIELTFSKVKQSFKVLRAQKLVGLIQDSHEAMVVRAIKSLRK